MTAKDIRSLIRKQKTRAAEVKRVFETEVIHGKKYQSSSKKEIKMYKLQDEEFVFLGTRFE